MAWFRKTDGELFEKYYKEMLSIIRRSSIRENAEFELVPAMAVVADYTAASAGRDRYKVANSIIPAISRVYGKIDAELMDSRSDLYGEIIRGRELHGYWYLTIGDINKVNLDAVGKCVALLGDFLYNPICRDDYNKMVIFVRGIDQVIPFIENVIKPLNSKMREFSQAIYNNQ